MAKAREEMETGPAEPEQRPAGPQGAPGEVFRVFLALGLTSFGGPVAHLGYFREAIVARRKWMGEAAYADLIALCQFLPGPASSQVGMALGLQRAGIAGLLAAWTAFTLPSALLMAGFAFGAVWLADVAGGGWIAGLKAAAVAVVAHALLGMARSLAPDRERATIAVAAMVAALLLPTALGQVAVIAGGGLAGLMLRPDAVAGDDGGLDVPISRMAAMICLAVFALLLAGLPFLAALSAMPALALFDSFYRAGSLVFGGGHVVLPLLQAEVVETGLVGKEAFLAGYGAAQAVPGPLFTIAAYLGAASEGAVTGWLGAAVALVAIFLPSGLLVVGALPFWSALRTSPLARRMLMGVNAAVVGLLAAALYDPVFTEGVRSAWAMAVVAAAFLALAAWHVPAWAVVLAAGLAGGLLL
ncbi:MAG: chromate efflux transporter [Methyloligellaceae bacterium]